MKKTKSNFWKSAYWIFEAITLLVFLIISLIILFPQFHDIIKNETVENYLLHTYFICGAFRIFRFALILNSFPKFRFIL